MTNKFLNLAIGAAFLSVGIIIAIGMFATAAPDISSKVATNHYNATGKNEAGGPLENIDSTSKTVWSNVPVFYALIPLSFMGLGVYSVYRGLHD